MDASTDGWGRLFFYIHNRKGPTMPRHAVRLYIEDSHLPDGEAAGGDCSHLLFDGPDDPDPSNPGATASHPAFTNPFAHALIKAMGISPVRLNHAMMDWSHGDGAIGLMQDNPAGHVRLPDEHTAFSGKKTRLGFAMSRNTIVEFSTEHMLINLLPDLAWYASGEDSGGFLITRLLTATQGAGITEGTPLQRVIDIPALSHLVISRVTAKADGIHEIRLINPG
ncbi:hypothetical protein [uncultured Salinicola sp.]|uniref:hypothetical protein n=1 Tax=uncultured Salinicola sp. TaxID=1193542 RepID=UPI002629FFBF|nr:hypothetical protein [uncultured Salinicola sp.]